MSSDLLHECKQEVIKIFINYIYMWNEKIFDAQKTLKTLKTIFAFDILKALSYWLDFVCNLFQ